MALVRQRTVPVSALLHTHPDPIHNAAHFPIP